MIVELAVWGDGINRSVEDAFEAWSLKSVFLLELLLPLPLRCSLPPSTESSSTRSYATSLFARPAVALQ